MTENEKQVTHCNHGSVSRQELKLESTSRHSGSAHQIIMLYIAVIPKPGIRKVTGALPVLRELELKCTTFVPFHKSFKL